MMNTIRPLETTRFGVPVRRIAALRRDNTALVELDDANGRRTVPASLYELGEDVRPLVAAAGLLRATLGCRHDDSPERRRYYRSTARELVAEIRTRTNRPRRSILAA